MKNGTSSKVLNTIGIILCVIIAPMLIINSTLIVKSWIYPDTVPTFGGIFPMIVMTDSMNSDDSETKIEAGDLIVCKTVDGEACEVGDVVTFYDPDGNGTTTVTHRITAKDTIDGVTVYTTKGDANNVEDQSKVKASDILGKYLFRLKGLGKVALFMQSSAGLIVCVGIPILLFVAYDLLRRRAARKDKSDKIAELEQQIAELKKGSGVAEKDKAIENPAASDMEARESAEAEHPTDSEKASDEAVKIKDE